MSNLVLHAGLAYFAGIMKIQVSSLVILSSALRLVTSLHPDATKGTTPEHT